VHAAADPLTRLFVTVRDYLLERLWEASPITFDRFAAPLRAIDPGVRRAVADTESPPVLDHLPTGLAAVSGTGRVVVATLAASESTPPWSPVYAETDWSLPFGHLVAVSEIAGLNGPIPAADASLGLMLCGPGLEYPRHAHPAAEVYVALGAGGVVERNADGVWHPLAAGDASYHPPDSSHAFRTGDLPVLIAYSWQGDIVAPTWWKRDMTDPAEPRLDAHRIG
jgi:hypothetical protein